MSAKTEPVLLNGTAASIAAAATPLLLLIGVQADDAGRVGSLVGAGLAFVLVVVSLFSARSKVTPLTALKAADNALEELEPIAAPGLDEELDSTHQPTEGVPTAATDT